MRWANGDLLTPEQLNNKTVPVVNLKDFGVRADGSTDDTDAVQDAIEEYAEDGAQLIVPGRMRCNSSIYVHGAISIIGIPGLSSIIVNGATNKGSSVTFMACGVKSDATNDRWSGKISGLTFEQGEDLTAGGRIINVFDASDYELSFCKLGTDWDLDWTFCRGQSHSSWGVTAGSVRQYGRYLYNTLTLNQTSAGAEQISVSSIGSGSVYAKYISMIGNHVQGCGDDAYALHGVEDFELIGNKAFTEDGRYLIGNCVRGRIIGNHAEHTSASGGSSLFLIKAADDGGPTRYTSDLVVVGNSTRVRSGQTITNSWDLRGVTDSLFSANEVNNESANASGFNIASITIDATDYLCGRLTLTGNYLKDSRISASASGRDDWLHIGPNSYEADTFTLASLHDIDSTVAGDEIIGPRHERRQASPSTRERYWSSGLVAIADNSATSVFSFKMPNPTSRQNAMGASFEGTFEFSTYTTDSHQMTSNVRLAFSVARHLDRNTDLSAITFESAVASGETGSNGSHTALDVGQFALAIASGAASAEQVIELRFTNDYDAGATARALLTGRFSGTCASTNDGPYIDD